MCQAWSLLQGPSFGATARFAGIFDSKKCLEVSATAAVVIIKCARVVEIKSLTLFMAFKKCLYFQPVSEIRHGSVLDPVINLLFGYEDAVDLYDQALASSRASQQVKPKIIKADRPL